MMVKKSVVRPRYDSVRERSQRRKQRAWVHLVVHGAFGLRQDPDKRDRREGAAREGLPSRGSGRGYRTDQPFEGSGLQPKTGTRTSCVSALSQNSSPATG